MTTTTLHSTLETLRGQVIRAGVIRAILWAAAVTALGLIAAAWVDLVVDLPGAARLAAVMMTLALLVIVGVMVLRRGMNESKPAVIASRLDAVGRQHGQIAAGVDLLLRPSVAAGTLGAGLASLAIDRAAELARHVPAGVLAPAADRRKPLYLLGGALAIVVLAGLIAPRMVHTQWLRFSDPFGDHPPYSSLIFNITPGHARVLYGHAADVQVTLEGGQVERLDLVLRDAAARDEPIPMFPVGGGQWRATIASVTAPGEYFVRTGRARSVRYGISVITVPQIEKVMFTVTPPAYTNRPAYNGPLPQGGLSGLPGTRVKVTATSNRELKSGTIAFTPSAVQAQGSSLVAPLSITLAPIAAGSRDVSGEFEITTAGKIEIGVSDTAGQPSSESFAAPVTVLRDDKPFVRLTMPKSNSYATPNAVVEINALAEDDFGIAKVAIFRALNETRPRAMEFDVPSPAPTRFNAQTTLKISDYGLKPGDVVKIFARVEDNDPAGAKGSESPTAMIHIISQADMDRMVLAREGLETLEAKYAAAARQLESIADKVKTAAEELAKLDPNSPLAEQKRRELEALAAAAEQAAQEVMKQADHTLPLDLDKALNKNLTEAADSLKKAAAQVRSAAMPGQPAGEAKKKLDEAQAALGQQRKEMKEKVQDPLEHLAAIYPLIEDQNRFLQLVATQKDLAFRLQSMETQKGDDNPQIKARMRELQEEQEQVRQQLEKLSMDIREHVQKLPDDPKVAQLRDTALDFVKRLDESGAGEQMSKAEQSLQEFAGTRAFTAASDAARRLEALIGRCNSMGEQGEQCLSFQPTLSEALGNTVDQLLESAGVGKKRGMGRGQGGYSAQRSSLQNVGLYGATPRTGKESSATGDGKADKGIATEADGKVDRNANPDGRDTRGATKATGQSDVPVPPQYQGRVSDYFRSVADELEQ